MSTHRAVTRWWAPDAVPRLCGVDDTFQSSGCFVALGVVGDF